MTYDIDLIQSLCKVNEHTLHKVLKQYFSQLYKNIIDKPDSYLIAVNSDSPYCLVAHADTVFETPPKTFLFDPEQKVMWGYSDTGASGFDDRAGVAMIVKLLKDGFRPNIIITHGEERGCIGATELVSDYPDSPIPHIKFLLEIDRKGHNEVVYYNTDNDDFRKYIEDFGFERNLGSFSDVLVLSSAWNLCECNVSAGYENEHCFNEVLHLDWWYDTFSKVSLILSQSKCPDFKHIEEYGSAFSRFFSEEDMATVKCAGCNKSFYTYELVPGYDNKLYCPDCAVNHGLSWCRNCGKPIAPGKALCEVCLEDMDEL